MAKKKPGQVPNRHIYTRISFLYQAALCLAQTATLPDPNITYRHQPQAACANIATAAATAAAGADAIGLAVASVISPNTENYVDREQDQHDPPSQHSNPAATTSRSKNMSRKLLTDMRAITQKSVIRVSPHIKRSICKYCDSLLIDGQTSSSLVENKSKGGKKPWADVLVIGCHTCGREKRFPINAPGHERRKLRNPNKQKAPTLPDATPSAGDQAT